MVKNKLSEKICADGFILDGYPRTIPQAEFLGLLHRIDRVMNFALSDEEIIKRISGRRTCRTCGSVYHVIYQKPKKENICDKCGSALVQRDDEKTEVVRKRLDVYKNQTEPLIKYYSRKKLLVNIDAYPEISEVSREVQRYSLARG